MTERLAVVLFNLGGPDGPEAVEPFLFNLFNDRAIIGLPQPLRWCVATMISRRRAPLAREIYAQIGGRSPILPETEAQARALEIALRSRQPDDDIRVFTCMRYWTPRARDVAAAVQAFAPSHIVLIPLYPQMSTTTTRSSVEEWKAEMHRRGPTPPMSAICCYPAQRKFISAHVDLLGKKLRELGGNEHVRVLFSAHGLPQRVIERGDPYQWQVERTAEAIAQRLALPDWVVCYQSRVGPLQWIGPSTEDEIRRAGRDGLGVVVVPIAFVSEHSETLVELDRDYAKLAGEAGVRPYLRVPALGAAPDFIEGLADLVASARTRTGSAPEDGRRICPAAFRACACGA